MSRLVNTEGIGKQRTRLLKAVALALRSLAGRQKIDDETRDLVAFMALALHEISATLEVTCAAWEKRDYWLKADQFRRDWAWAGRLARQLEEAVLNEHWPIVAALMPQLAEHVGRVELPKRNTLGTPWLGAYAQLREMRGWEKKLVVKQ